eukprot:1448719-Rhodomonas_salina.3
MRCSVLRSAIGLRVRYAVCGTELGHGSSDVRTEPAYGAMGCAVLSESMVLSPYALAMQRAVLISRMVLRSHGTELAYPGTALVYPGTELAYPGTALAYGRPRQRRRPVPQLPYAHPLQVRYDRPPPCPVLACRMVLQRPTPCPVLAHRIGVPGLR